MFIVKQPGENHLLTKLFFTRTAAHVTVGHVPHDIFQFNSFHILLIMMVRFR